MIISIVIFGNMYLVTAQETSKFFKWDTAL